MPNKDCIHILIFPFSATGEHTKRDVSTTKTMQHYFEIASAKSIALSVWAIMPLESVKYVWTSSARGAGHGFITR